MSPLPALPRHRVWLPAAIVLLLSACQPAAQAPATASAPAAAPSPASAPAAAAPVHRLASLPDGVELRGKLAAAYGWSDAAGQQLLVLGERQDERAADGTQSAMLYAAQYTLGQGKPRRQWMLSDGVERCEFDAGAGFDLDALSFPDLNRDGVLETVIGYHSTCTSDVSPNDYKLILHAGKAKYGLRGLDRQGMSWLDPEHGLSSRLPLPTDCSPQAQLALQAKGWEREFEPPYLPGCYTDENDFATAPPAFVKYMRKQWFARMRELESSWIKRQQE